MEFNELTNEQRRQLIDARQLFTVWREARDRFAHSYKGTMRWANRDGHAYLIRATGRIERSLGPRSPETEKLKADYMAARQALRQRKTRLAARLKDMAPVNRALRLGRVPRIAARILRGFDDAGLLGAHLHVVGTNALYAYEARAGVSLGGDLLATGDADLLWDARRSLRLVLEDVRAQGVIGLLRKVDRSFAPTGPRSFRAVNDDGYLVDLICPAEKDIRRPRKAKKIGEVDDDLLGVEIFGLEWLINAPKFEEIVIGEDGAPLMMACVDPRVFALHKLWVAQREDRAAIQRGRDVAQAECVAELCGVYFRLKFDAPELSALPKALRALAKEPPIAPAKR